MIIPHLGEILALICAMVWGLAVILFKKSGEVVHPLALNLFKVVLGVVLLLPTTWIAGQFWPSNASCSDIYLLLLSGALAIGISDTLFFMALNRLGAGLTAIVDCLYSPSVITLSVLFLGESMRWLQLAGALIIVSAVFIASFEKPHHDLSHTQKWQGILYGALAMIFVAVGVVIAKPLLTNLPVLWVTEVRMLGGLIVILLTFFVFPHRRAILNTLITSHHRGYTFAGSFFGAYVSTVLWLGGMKYTQASTAAALNQTSNVFVFLMAWIILKEPINLKRAMGITLAVCGAYLVMFG
jgi:drug/metabolite transporter (DMT)-like permease